MTEAPIAQEIWEIYQDQGLEVVAFGADWYPDGAYSCTGWSSAFGVEYPILDFETGAENWYNEEIPYTLFMPELGWGLPYNIVIDHEMNVVWGSAQAFDEDIMAEAIAAIESSLEYMHLSYSGENYDDDDDGINNDCDPCPRSDLYAPGNLDFSEELIIDGSDYYFAPSVDVIDVLLLADLVQSGDEISECIVEANDFTGDGYVNIGDLLALAFYILEGN
mgnify:CR=1 FL=1